MIWGESVCFWPVAGLVTLQLSCWTLFRGQAAAVFHMKVYTQSSMSEIRVGREFYVGHINTCLFFIFFLYFKITQIWTLRGKSSEPLLHGSYIPPHVWFRKPFDAQTVYCMFYSLTAIKHFSWPSFEYSSYHFVFVTLEADDTDPVAASIWTSLAAGVLQH